MVVAGEFDFVGLAYSVIAAMVVLAVWLAIFCVYLLNRDCPRLMGKIKLLTIVITVLLNIILIIFGLCAFVHAYLLEHITVTAFFILPPLITLIAIIRGNVGSLSKKTNKIIAVVLNCFFLVPMVLVANVAIGRSEFAYSHFLSLLCPILNLIVLTRFDLPTPWFGLFQTSVQKKVR